MSVGYLHGLKSKFSYEDLAEVPYDESRLDSLAEVIFERRDKIQKLQQEPVFLDNIL